jgi:cell division septation protein DedD
MYNINKFPRIQALGVSVLSILTASAVLAGSVDSQPASLTDQDLYQRQTLLQAQFTGPHAIDSYIVQFKPNVDRNNVIAMTTGNAGEIVPLYPNTAGDKQAIEFGLDRTFIVSTDNITDDLNLLVQSRNIEYTEPIAIGNGHELEAQVTRPNDPIFPQQDNLENTGQNGGVIGADINWLQAYGITNGNPAITIAVIDTGFNQNGDIKNVVPGVSTVPYTTSTRDDHNPGHGTQNASIALSNANDGNSIAGVCPDCSLMPIKAFYSDNTFYDTDVLEAIYWAISNGAQIISISGGSRYGWGVYENISQYVTSRGVIIVASAGNTGTMTAIYPAANSYVIGVTATNNFDTYPSWSTFGPLYKISAPGGGETPAEGILAISANGTVSKSRGTSRSAPQVAGVIGLMQSWRLENGKPLLTPQEITWILIQSAKDLGPAGFDDHYNNGRLDAGAALVLTSNFNGIPVITPTMTPTRTQTPTSTSAQTSLPTSTQTPVGTHETPLSTQTSTATAEQSNTPSPTTTKPTETPINQQPKSQIFLPLIRS